MVKVGILDQLLSKLASSVPTTVQLKTIEALLYFDGILSPTTNFYFLQRIFRKQCWKRESWRTCWFCWATKMLNYNRSLWRWFSFLMVWTNINSLFISTSPLSNRDHYHWRPQTASWCTFWGSNQGCGKYFGYQNSISHLPLWRYSFVALLCNCIYPPVAHQGTIVKEGLLEPMVGLLAIENSRVRLKTLETIYHFDRMFPCFYLHIWDKFLPKLVEAKFLTYIPLLLQDKDNDVKSKGKVHGS